MAKKETKRDHRTVSLEEFLVELPAPDLKKGELSQRLEDLALETQLLSLADVSIERETEGLKEILKALGRL